MFIAPAFLAGLLAIALPLWLHRIAQANPTRHPFPSLMLMEPSELQRSARRTLRYWLLLFLRILLIAALALAFAGPLLSPRAVPKVDPAGRLHAIVVDTSLSMQHADRWPRALSEARLIVEHARPGDELMLVRASGHRIEVIQEAVGVQQAGQVLAALDAIEPGHQRLDYGLLMSTAKGFLSATRLPVELHLISDMQQSAGPLRFADLEPPSGSELRFHDVAVGDSSNTYIRDVRAGSDGKLTVDVRTTAASVLALEAVALVDGEAVTRRAFKIGPASVAPPVHEGEGSPPEEPFSQPAQHGTTYADATVTLTLPELTPVAHRVEVRLGPADALAADDRFYRVFEQTNPRVLVLSRGNDSDEAIYAAAAIDSLTAPKLHAQALAAQELDVRTLPQFAAVMVTDPAALSSAAVARIHDFVRGGGSLFMTFNSGTTEGLLADWRVRNAIAKPTRIAQVDATHPVLRNPAGWNNVHVLRHVQVIPEDDDRVLIALEDGTPLLIERKFGAGRMLVLSSPLSREWNDLATHAVFVRFMADMASYLTDAEATASSAQVGDVLMTGLSAERGGQIFDPRGQRVLGLGGSTPSDRIVPERPGFYEIRSAGASRWVAVNVDGRESQLARMPGSTLQRWQSLQTPLIRKLGGSVEATATEDRVSIGYALLLACLVLLLLETIVANHFLAVRREVPR